MTWERVLLKDLGTWYGGGTPSKSNRDFWTDGDVPWLSPKDMGPEVLSSTIDRVTKAAVAGSSTKLLPAGSVAVVARSGILERTVPVAVVPFETAMNQDMKAVVPNEGVDARWIAWGLRAHERQLLRETRKAGTTVASIEMPRFYHFELPLPGLDEQRRIVAILEDHLSRLGAAESYLRSSERRVEAWRSAATQRELWLGDPVERPVGDLLREAMRNGRSDRAVKGSAVGTRTLTLTAVTRNQFTDEFTKMTVTAPEIAQGLWLEPGDILVQRSNTPELVGTAARYDGPKDWAIFPDLLVRLRPDELSIEGRFLAAALQSEKVHRELRARAKGLAGSMPKIDQRSIAETTVPVPSLSRQRQAIDRIAEIEDSAAAALTQIARQRLRAAVLRRSLLAGAFSGRLIRPTSDAPNPEEMIGT